MEPALGLFVFAYVVPIAEPSVTVPCSQLEGRLLTKFCPLISLSSGAGE